jgi:predicted dehydrogenase
MVGGGPGAFIGEVHRKAARLDGGIELVAGAFSSDPDKSRAMGQELYLDPARTYASFQEMAEAEAKLPEGERIDFVSVVTPNHVHFPVAKTFLEAGFHVICDKPMTFTLDEARKLKAIVDSSGLVFALTHNYTGYPMVKLARDLAREGELGRVLKIIVQYPQGWLIHPIEREGAKQAAWRTDPAKAGASCCMGDIGTHAENLAEYITGLRISEICADLTTFVEGRPLEDDGNCLLRFEGGAKGILFASQISIGEENNLAIWVYGEKKSLEWHQEYPNDLWVRRPDGPVEKWRRGNDYVGGRSPAAGRATRLPFGHPEAFIEAFANVYVNATDTMRKRILGQEPDALELDFPTVDDGLRGMAFIETVVESASNGAVWTKMKS